MKIAGSIVLMAVIAVSASGACIGRPSDTLRGWKSVAAWTLPGDVYGVAYVCSDTGRKILIERFGNRIVRDVRYVSDVTLPKLLNGEMLLEGAECTRDGVRDPYIVPFGVYAKNGVARVHHAWRVEVPSGRIVTVDAKSVRCDSSRVR